MTSSLARLRGTTGRRARYECSARHLPLAGRRVAAAGGGGRAARTAWKDMQPVRGWRAPASLGRGRPAPLRHHGRVLAAPAPAAAAPARGLGGVVHVPPERGEVLCEPETETRWGDVRHE